MQEVTKTEGHISIPNSQIPEKLQMAMLTDAIHGLSPVLKLTISSAWLKEGFSIVSEYGKETVVEIDFYEASVEVDFWN